MSLINVGYSSVIILLIKTLLEFNNFALNHFLLFSLIDDLSVHLNFHFLTYGDFSLHTYKQSRHNLVHDYTSSQVREELSLLQTYLQQFWSGKSGNDGHFQIKIFHDPNFYDITVSISANSISNIYYVNNVANSGEGNFREGKFRGGKFRSLAMESLNFQNVHKIP